MLKRQKKTEGEENLPEEVLEADTVKQFADAGTETDSIIEAPVKAFVDVGTQTEPVDVFIDQPVIELTPERRRRNMVLDQTRAGCRSAECSNKH